jgi:anti-sigma factor RsiW
LPPGFLVEDFDLDGRPDVAVAQEGVGITVFWNEGSGFAAVPLVSPQLTSALTLASGDLDGDGLLDLLVLTFTSAVAVTNQGARVFVPRGVTALSDHGRVAEIVDVDADGHMDALVASSDRLHLLRGDRLGRRLFIAHSIVLPMPGSVSFLSEDFDQDGDPDVVWADVGGMLHFHAGLGDGSFGPAVSTPLPSPALRLAAGEFAGGGFFDLVAPFGDGALRLLVNLLDGTFLPVTIRPGPPGPGRTATWGLLELADFDRDGFLDIIARPPFAPQSSLQALFGAGDGTFPLSLDVELGLVPGRLAFADFTDDDVLDALALVFPASARTYELALVRGTAPARLAAPRTFALAAIPRELEILDLDRDGLRDLVAVGRDRFHLLRQAPRGAPAGGFFEPEEFEFPGRDFWLSLAADLDGDGAEELALADPGRDELLIVSLSPRDEVPSVRTVELPGSAPAALVTADLDGDGALDLAAPRRGTPDMHLIFHVGSTGAREAIDVVIGSLATGVAAGRIDGDGFDDLVVGTLDGPFLVLGGAGTGLRVEPLAGPTRLRDIHLGDFDRDGELDLVAWREREIVVVDSFATAPEVRTFRPPVLPAALRLADFDADGSPEAFAVWGDTLAVLPLPGLAQERPPRRFMLPAPARLLVVEDIDGDGLLDCVVGDPEVPAITLVRGIEGRVPASFRRGDADASGAVDLTDAAFLLDRLFRGGAPLRCEDAGDADDDGALTITDAVFLLAHLFRGGPAPPPPGPGACGPDPTADALAECDGRCA